MVRPRHAVRRATRREMVWLGLASTTGQTALAAGTAVLVSSLNAAALALRPFTVVRTRGYIYTESDQDSANEQPFGAFGQIVVKETAAAAGVASIPTPMTETDVEFFVYEAWMSALKFGSTVAFNSPSGTVTVFDSKAQRKVGIDETIVSVIENQSANHGAFFLENGRQLVKLH